MSVEKISLNSFRAFLFFFFGGAGCWLPFVSLHLKSTGLSSDEIRLISFVSPLFATLGPIVIGPLVDYLSGKRKSEVAKKSSARGDRNAYARTVLSITVLLSAVFYCLLLSISTIDNVNQKKPEAAFVCNEHGASLVQPKCNDMKCFRYSNLETGTATLGNCKFNCDLPSHYGYLEKPFEEPEVDEVRARPVVTTTSTTTTRRTTTKAHSLRPEVDISNLDDFFGSDPNDDYDDVDSGSGQESDFNWNKRRLKRNMQSDSGFLLEESPHICHNKIVLGKTSRTCFVFTPNSAAFNVTIHVRPFHEDDHYCSYSLEGSNFSCRIPRGLEKPNESCKVVCDLDKVYAQDDSIVRFQCGQFLEDPTLTFWTYLTFRCLGDFFFASSVALIIGATLLAAGEDAGREFILPTLSYGLMATIVGYLHSDDLSPLHLENIPNFSLGIIGFGLFIIIALLVLIFASNLCMGSPDLWKTYRNVQARQKVELCAVLLVLILLGMLWGPIYFHVPWHLPATEGLELYVGCAAALGALLSLALVWKAYKIVDYCGYSNLLIGAFTIYILSYTGLLFIENPWVLAIVGGMRAINLCLALFSAFFYIRHLVPKNLTFTTQALGIAAHFCIGGGLGCLAATFLTPTDSELEGKSLNSTKSFDFSLENILSEDEFRVPHHLLYCVGAVTAAVSAVAYFFLYHCCLKKRCLAPLYRNDHNGANLHESSEKGMYTPLRIIRNGKEVKDEVET